MNEVLDAAWSMMVTVDDFAEVVLSGVPRKSEPHRLLLPPPQTQRRPHGTGLEPAGPTARPSGEAETAVVAWTPRGTPPNTTPNQACRFLDWFPVTWPVPFAFALALSCLVY